MLSSHPVCAVAVVASLADAACGSPPSGKPVRRAKQRVFVLGFDGMDPTLARQFMDEGKLPNLKRLAETGTFAKLETTQPSESPVAWASFATGVNPGKHNIYDFLVRDLETYMPDLGMVEDGAAGVPVGPLPDQAARRSTSTRGGTSFWVHAGNDGVQEHRPHRAHDLPAGGRSHHGEMLAGLPLPDIRGTLGHLQLLGHRPQLVRGGQHRVRRLPEAPALRGRRGADRSCKGPENPILRQEERELRDEEGGGRALRRRRRRGSRSWPRART